MTLLQLHSHSLHYLHILHPSSGNGGGVLWVLPHPLHHGVLLPQHSQVAAVYMLIQSMYASCVDGTLFISAQKWEGMFSSYNTTARDAFWMSEDGMLHHTLHSLHPTSTSSSPLHTILLSPQCMSLVYVCTQTAASNGDPTCTSFYHCITEIDGEECYI